MIRVIKGKVKFNGVYYGVGDVISGLSEQDEARLVKKGVAEYVRELVQERPTEPTEPEKETTNQETEEDVKAEVQENEQGEEQDEHTEAEDQEETPAEPTDTQIDFNPDDCIVTEDNPKPAPKKATPVKNHRKK